MRLATTLTSRKKKKSLLCIANIYISPIKVVLYFFSILRVILKKSVWNFLFSFFLFCSLVRNENIKRPGFFMLQSSRGFIEFSSAKIAKQNKEHVWILWSSWILICLSWRFDIVIRNLIVTVSFRFLRLCFRLCCSHSSSIYMM